MSGTEAQQKLRRQLNRTAVFRPTVFMPSEREEELFRILSGVEDAETEEQLASFEQRLQGEIAD